MCSLSSAAAGNRSLRSLIRCGGDAPGGNSRPARGGCSVTRRAAVRWASSCLPLLPLFRTLRDRPRRALANHHSSRVQGGAGTSGPRWGPTPRRCPPSGSGQNKVLRAL